MIANLGKDEDRSLWVVSDNIVPTLELTELALTGLDGIF
jgi:hypothetical protein